MTNTNFHVNDVAKLQGKVLKVNYERTAAYLDVAGRRYWVEVDDLELVERPSPRLEDLLHGTVIRRSDANPDAEIVYAIVYVVCGNHQLHSLIGHTTTFERITFPIEILGACPGTPAWEPWLKAFNHADGDPDYIGEWWRSE